MKKVFQDKYHMECVFEDTGVTFCNSKRCVYYPYGSLDSLNVSLMGIMQAVSRAHVCCFAVTRENKAEIKEQVKLVKQAMKTAPRADAVVIDVESIGVDQTLAPEEQLKQYKNRFLQGVLNKEQYDVLKKVLSR